MPNENNPTTEDSQNNQDKELTSVESVNEPEIKTYSDNSTVDETDNSTADLPQSEAITYVSEDNSTTEILVDSNENQSETNEVSSSITSPVITAETMRLEEKQLIAERDSALATARRGTQSLGLFLLRVGLGLLLCYSGFQKLFPASGLTNIRSLLVDSGYSHSEILALVVGVSELAAGVFLVLGLATPVAAATAAAIFLQIYFFHQAKEAGFQLMHNSHNQNDITYTYVLILFLISVVLVLVGPGGISLDRGRGWVKRPFLGSALLLILALAVSVFVWIVFNGGAVI